LNDSFELRSLSRNFLEHKINDADIEKKIMPLINELEIIDHVDLSTLKEMSSDEDFNKKIIEYFLENFPQELQSLEKDILENNKMQVKFKVHKMKTPLSMFGLKNFIEKLDKIEKLCNDNVNNLPLIVFNSLNYNIKIILEELRDIFN
jgi:HPt (histidine-containing phosphotransfer) domain-containing protein